jgi:hypothetical protein
LEGKSNTARVSAIAILSALLLGGGCVYYLWDSGDLIEGIAIDGSFADWDGKEMTKDPVGDSMNNSNIDIIETGITIDNVYTSFLIKTSEPLFFDEGNTIRIMLDTDNYQNTGYFLPGFGADYMVEIYGKSNGRIDTSLLYVFDNNKGTNDWNGFYSLSNLKSNITSAQSVGSAIELQIPNFDIGIKAGDPLRYIIAATDSNGNFDTTNIIDLGNNEYLFVDNVKTLRNTYNENNYRKGLLDGIDIDGTFTDWKQNANIKSDSNDDIDSSVDILQYANFTDKSGDTFYYVNVEETILGGSNFTDIEARHKNTQGNPNFDISLEDSGISEIKYDLPVLNGRDEIFIFIDSDYNTSTGYMSETIGADKLIQITGQYGIITDSTIGNYNGIDNAWNWISKVDTAAANDYDEIEVLGTDGNYYIHITSWNKEDDIVEAEIMNKITLPDNATGEDGNRAGTPTFPSSWTLVNNDEDDGLASDIEILSVHAAWDGEYLFVKITTESAFNIVDSTMGIIIDDNSDGSSNYMAACSSSRSASTNYGFTYQWVGGSVWVDQSGEDSDYTDHIKINDGHNGIQLACDKDEIGFSSGLDLENDIIRAVSTDSDEDAFGDTSYWQLQNIPSNSLDDITDATAIGIPEFSTIMMPVASVLLIVGNRIRNKKTTQQ